MSRFRCFYILSFVFKLVSTQTCTYPQIRSDIVSNAVDMANTVVRVLVSSGDIETSVKECQSFCVRGWRLPDGVCSGFSVSTNPVGTCYLYSNINDNKLDTTGSDRLYKKQCSGGGGNVVNCEYTNWSGWSSCTVTCGVGSQIRTRAINTQGSNGGTLCDTSLLTETQVCSINCPVNCVYSNWSLWGTCSASCGGGSQERTRTILTQGSGGGTVCDTGSLSETKSCNTMSCPVNCVYSNWSSWATCSASCGGGNQERTRIILTNGSGGGTNCDNGALRDTKSCNTMSCPVNCAYSTWGSWGTCSASCAGGSQERTRIILTNGSGGGTNCDNGFLRETQSCNTMTCPCVVSTWGSWTTCTENCGTGTQTRSRSVTGSNCNDSPTESQFCNTTPCPINCTYSTWSQWNSCSADCGTGSQTRSRSILDPARNGGSCFNVLTENQPCNTNPCPSDCVWSTWSPWGTCSSRCNGTQSRSRSVTTPAKAGGSCKGSSSDQQNCNTDRCPVDCILTSWSVWSSCSAICGSGTRTRKRSIFRSASNGGLCSGPFIETKSCIGDQCPSDCIVTAWTEWTSCSVTCGRGTKSRSRMVDTPAADGGVCPFELTQNKECATNACQPDPLDCILSSWTSWQKCSAKCGQGIQTRTRVVIRSASNGGRCNEHLNEQKSCNAGSCPSNCKFSNWSNWGECSVSCGFGSERRTRILLQKSTNGGQCSDSLTETKQCHKSCQSDCKPTKWSDWGECSVICGGGVRSRTRPITNQNCRHTTVEYQTCNVHSCHDACNVTEWSQWSACTASCAGGTQTRSRTATGECAISLSETRTCNNNRCFDCSYSDWSPWQQCNVTCGGGSKIRSRSVIQGNDCREETNQAMRCNIQMCNMPTVCMVSSWTKWTQCNKLCNGIQTRSRRVILSPPNKGRCPYNLNETQHCNAGMSCGPGSKCKLSNWTSWSSCSVTCGEGHQVRTRSISQQGNPCDDLLSQNRKCATTDCNQGSCSWAAWSSCSVSCGIGRETREKTGTGCALGVSKGSRRCARKENCNPQWYYDLLYRSVNRNSQISSVGRKTLVNSKDCTTACNENKDFECTGFVTDGNTCIIHGMIDKPIFLTAGSGYSLFSKRLNQQNLAPKSDIFYTDYFNVDPTKKLSSNGFSKFKNSTNCTEQCLANKEFTCFAYVWKGVGSNCYLHGKIDQSLYLVHGSKYAIYHHVQHSIPSPPMYSIIYQKFNGIDPRARLSSTGFEVISQSKNCSQHCLDHKTFKCEAYVSNGPNDHCYLHGHIDKKIYLQDGSPFILQEMVQNTDQLINHTICGFKHIHHFHSINEVSTNQVNQSNIVNHGHCELLCKMAYQLDFPCKAFAFKPLGNTLFNTVKFNCILYGEVDKDFMKNSDQHDWQLYVLKCINDH